MSANIASINGQSAMAYQGETPWHKLGTFRQSLSSVNEALEAGHLNGWNLHLKPLYRAGFNEGSYSPIPDRQAIIRQLDGEYISNVGPGYEILQNEEGFSVLDDVIKDHGVTIETAGALGRGERVWMLARLPESIEPVPGDKVNGYILIQLGHDGMKAHTGILTPIRVVCQNTLNLAVSNAHAGLFKFRHIKSIKDKQQEAADLITGMVAALKETGDTFSKLASKRLTPAQVISYIESVFPQPSNEKEVSKRLEARRQTVAELVWSGQGAELAGSDANGTTAWAAYNAVTEYFDHVRPAEAQKPSAKQSANLSALFGNTANVKVKALEQIRELVAV